MFLIGLKQHNECILDAKPRFWYVDACDFSYQTFDYFAPYDVSCHVYADRFVYKLQNIVVYQHFEYGEPSYHDDYYNMQIVSYVFSRRNVLCLNDCIWMFALVISVRIECPNYTNGK